jgi:hypothetical protein
MTARQVHALIAAGVENPLLVARWENEPQRLAAQGLDANDVDLDALAKFAGLTVKVRHNALRNDLPLTFRLLNVAGLEIEVFAAYAAFRAQHGGRYAATTAERTRELIAFLDDWLDRDRREHVLLWDLIRHEDALARGTPASRPAGLAASRRHRVTSRSVPHIRGNVLLHEMQSDPAIVAAVLREKTPPLDRVPFATRHVCYWRPAERRRDAAGPAGEDAAAPQIHILELDEFGFYALSLVDGTRSVADLSEALIGTRRCSRAFLQLLTQLVDLGILGT